MLKSKSIQVRDLTRGDRVVVSNLLMKIIEKTGTEGLFDIISSEPETGKNKNHAAKSKKLSDDHFVNIGIKLFQKAIQLFDEEIAAWFSSLIGCKQEEFNDQPFNVEIEIIRQLRKKEEINDFFSGALQEYREIQKLYSGLKPGKKK